MNKITKRAKKVKIIYRKYISSVSEYECPCCGIYFVGAGINEKVTRFSCKCGQELSVEDRIIVGLSPKEIK